MLIRSRAPLRLGFGGGGTDVESYSNLYGGNVLNATIAMYAYCTIEPMNDGKIIFDASDLGVKIECLSSLHLELDGELDLLKGIYNRIVKDYVKKPLSFKMTTFSEAGKGSGLGGSSTMVVAILHALMRWLKIPLGEYEVAELAFKIERQDVGLSGGKQDQFASAFGGFNFMEFHKNNQTIVNPLRISDRIVNELQSSLLLYFTGVSRDSGAIINDQIKTVLDKKNEGLDSMHAMKKNCIQMKEALLLNDLNRFSKIMNQSWKAKKGTSNLVTSNIIEEAYDTAMRNGAYAGKVNGAGGGGYMMFMVNPVRKKDVWLSLESLGGKVSVVNFSSSGATSWECNNE